MYFKIHKVTELPVVLEESSIYLVRIGETDELVIYVTDNTGSIFCRTQSLQVQTEQIESIVVAIINGLKDVPGGLASIDNNGLLSTELSFNGQDTIILSDSLQYLWKEVVSELWIRNTGGNNPSFSTVYGNFQGLIFSASTLQQTWTTHQIPHDYAVGTDLFLNINWLPIGNGSGRVRWGIEYDVVKSHGVGTFGSSTTVYLEENLSSQSSLKCYRTMMPSGSPIPGANLEPGDVIRSRVFRDAASSRDSFSGTSHAWSVGLHYQVSRIGTKNRAPDFFA